MRVEYYYLVLICLIWILFCRLKFKNTSDRGGVEVGSGGINFLSACADTTAVIDLPKMVKTQLEY